MTRPLRARVGAGLLGLALLLPLAAAAPASAAAADFPAGFTGYHTYAEMVADIDAVIAAHPTIVAKVSIGTSYKGRTMWAVKISDNVVTDEPEPEVLFDGLTHADEHMGLEMTLKIIHWLANGYGSDSRITKIVDTREVWVIPAVNPDGAEYDISGGKFHFWRKNRQPTPGTSYIGTDLNRNFSYRWGGGGRTSSNPAAITYRGPSAFSAPETRNIRDFLADRVVGGRQQITAAITFHEAGRLVMWPYGYTYADLPVDMTVDDHNALKIIGKYMAGTNGYKPEQASDLYITSGTTRDYEYGKYRIFAYTFEMSVKDYPDDSLISSETGRNRAAVLYLMERAGCPLAVLGLEKRILRCGAFDDDLEVARGWRVNADGTDSATSGTFTIGNPQPTSNSTGKKQLDGVVSGRNGLITGIVAGSWAGANDVDGGRTTATSPEIALPGTANQKLNFRWTFADDSAAVVGDELRAEVLDVDADTTTSVFVVHGTSTIHNGGWHLRSIDLSAYAGHTIRIRFSATDAGTNSLVEAGIDDVRVTMPQ